MYKPEYMQYKDLAYLNKIDSVLANLAEKKGCRYLTAF
jgi:hypothetical protein